MQRQTDSGGDADYTIRAQGFGAIDALLRELDVDPKSALAFVGLETDVFDEHNKNRLIDYRKFLNLLNHCAQLTERNDFGNLLSRYQDMSVIGVPGIAMYEAQNFRAALQDLIHFFHLHMDGMKVGFEEGSRISMVTLEIVMPFAPVYKQQIELSLGIGLRFVRRLLGDKWSPNEVFFEHLEDTSSASTQALFRCPVNYENELNGFIFNSSFLDVERDQFDSQARQILYDYLCLQSRAVKKDFVIEFREALINALRAGTFDIDTLSGSLGLSRRTLQRRLEDHGFHYSDLLEKTRMDLALRYLRTSRIPVTQVSDILGYTDVSSFSRSFKRFFGNSPRAWRIQNGV
jgi:AraC-like DNA-binding protein